MPNRQHEYGPLAGPPQARPARLPASRFPARRPGTRLINPARFDKKMQRPFGGIDDAKGFPPIRPFRSIESAFLQSDLPAI
jgi:hypothetical protein